MTLRALANCALIALHVLGTIASPVGISYSDELVRTPGGLVPKSNVHLVPEGGRVVHTPTAVQLIGADGTILHSAPLTGSTSFSPLRNVFDVPTPTSNAPRSLQSGYVAYAYWTPPSGPPISYFETTWTVPPPPTSWDGQTVYIFDALVPPSGDAILQPVLLYGYSPAGGGAYWSIASWYLLNGAVYFTGLIEVQPGQILTGILNNPPSTSGATYNWYSYFVVDGQPIKGTILTTTTTEELSWAYEALEIYEASTPENLPAGTTLMSGIEIYTGYSGAQPSAVPWTVNSDLSDNIFMTLVSSSSSNGAVVISYPVEDPQ